MAARKTKAQREQEIRGSTNAFLEELNGGPMTFGQMLGALRECEEESLSQFASRLGVSRQHLHQLESGQKRVSPERAVRYARILQQSELVFLQLALQDLVDESGLSAKVEIKVVNHPQSILAGAIGAGLWGAFRHEKLLARTA